MKIPRAGLFAVAIALVAWLAAAASETATLVKQGAGGTIRGQITYGGADIPAPAQVVVNKDQAHCLAKGPLLDETWVVNPKNKGVRWVVVFLKPPKGEKLPIPPALANPNPPTVELDQPMCAFVPHVLAMREDQKLIAKNPAPVPHNVVIKGFLNDINRQIPVGKQEEITLQAEKNAINVTCGIHPWMKGTLWVFEHPYFAVTDADGKFEIKDAPAGARNLVIWHEGIGWGPPGRDGRMVNVNANGVADLGEIKIP